MLRYSHRVTSLLRASVGSCRSWSDIRADSQVGFIRYSSTHSLSREKEDCNILTSRKQTITS